MNNPAPKESLGSRLRAAAKKLLSSKPKDELTGRRADRRWFYLPERKDVQIRDLGLQRLVGEVCTSWRNGEGRTYLSRKPRLVDHTIFVAGKPAVVRLLSTETMRRIDLLAAPGRTRRDKKAWLREMARQYAINRRAGLATA